MTAFRIDLVFPRFKLLSGAERAILGLATALVEGDHTVRVVCHQFDASCRPRLSPGVDLVCSGTRLDWSANRYLNAVSDYTRTLSLRHLLDVRADLYLLFGPALPLVCCVSDRVPAGRTIYYCWEPPRAIYQDRRLVLQRVGWQRLVLGPALRVYAALDRALVRRAGAVCTSSPFAARRIEAVYGRRASVITLGIDRDRLDRVSSVGRESPARVITVNYLHPRKRVHLFIQAAAAYEAAAGDARAPLCWVVVGDGPERVHLERLSEELGVSDQVEFAGFVADDDLPRYYASASCYVHTGLEESFGLSVIEASYCGCPVVAVDEGGVRETVEDAVTGYLVPPKAEEIARSVHSVLSQTDEGRAMGLSGRERVCRTYRWEQGAADIIEQANALKS